jgi:hypothetical protein
MRNGFPNRSVRRGKQEGVEDALVEYSPSIEADNMAGLMLYWWKSGPRVDTDTTAP